MTDKRIVKASNIGEDSKENDGANNQQRFGGRAARSSHAVD